MSFNDLSSEGKREIERLTYRQLMIERTYAITKEYESSDVYDLLTLMMKEKLSAYNKKQYIRDAKEMYKKKHEINKVAFIIFSIWTLGAVLLIDALSVSLYTDRMGNDYDRAAILYKLLSRKEIIPLDI